MIGFNLIPNVMKKNSYIHLNEGTAVYPEEPAYKPAPAYKAAPAPAYHA